jgi:hypothetical protein
MPTTRLTLKALMTVCLAGATPVACATYRGGGDGALHERLGQVQDPRGTTRRSDVVTAAELQSVADGTTSESLRRLRPEFFRPVQSALDPRDARVPVVYVDEAQHGGIEMLETVPKDAVQEIRFLRPMQAVERWGPSCPCVAGVIYVVTRKVH